ncbi:esterase-like activity of phytase family protein [Alkalimarinus alittae]|uniref:Esterase-like activity of phytase family protein n=1 Tax=Alkalimarinus alittae TaxID=2961619 RepID=A0ABY6N757_9ALTE|nr:esterase-like activity of phytase family protein [Alkalimarinus alittae]UZE97919.1 esterase-like activity of phytase family protein [Alkalimarinus alittae]
MLSNKTLLSASLSCIISLSGCSSDSSNKQAPNTEKEIETSAEAFIENFSVDGADLPYTVLRSDLIDVNTGVPFEVRNGGFGSAMTKDPKRNNRFYALTDRGPNATFTGDYGKGKKFPSPEYTPRIGLFEVGITGEVSLIKTTLLKRPDGTLITGLPNSSALGGTGETPYTSDGSPVLVDSSLPYNASTNPIKLDDYGLDPEGLVVLSDGSFWVSDEYGPHLVHFNAEGKEIERINAFTADNRVTHYLPNEFSYRRANRGMEGLTITPDEKTLVGIMQSTLYLPSKSVKSLDITRIVTVNIDTGESHQYLYKQEKPENSNSEISALSATEFLVIERDGSFLYGGPKGSGAANLDAMKHVYRLDLSTGTDLESIENTGNLIQDENLGLTINGNTLEEQVLADGDWSTLAANNIVPVEKSLVVDMVAEVDYPHDKMEGLWVINDNYLGVLNDDDFATWSTSSGELEQKMLNSNAIDGNHLYIIPVDISVSK